MKTFFLFAFILFSGLLWAQNPVVLKVRLHQSDKESQISFQKNEEAVIKIGQNEYRNIDVKLNDVLSFFVNNELIEHIEISQNIIDRKSLNLVITGSEVLDELEIEYTDLNAMLGMKGERYTRAERAVYFALQMVPFINANTKIDSPEFKELMEQQLLHFDYED